MTLFRSLTACALVLCTIVVVLGAYVRLSDAGLGCPDWPGCYGHLTVPSAAEQVAAAQQAFPDRPFEHAKAWKEMVHRYAASMLGLLILLLAALSLRAGFPKTLPRVLLGLVLFQGILGMWTVTWLLKPIAVTAHLLGGMATLGLLAWLWFDLGRTASGPAGFSRGPGAPAATRALRFWSALAVVLVAAQIFLGGWTSSNYAALACPDLPTCQGTLQPELDLREAFTLWRGVGPSYEYGVLDNRARVTIHWLHRIGALVLAAYLVVLAGLLWRRGGAWRRVGQALLAALTLQAAIGVGLIVLQLPLPLAAAHNAGAALLWLVVIALTHRAWRTAP